VSASGDLVYVAGGVHPPLTLLWVDRKGTEQEIPIDVGNLIRLSPDRKQLAYRFGGDLWVSDLLRSTPIRLTFDNTNGWPVWSPDGRSLVYSTTLSGVLTRIAPNTSGHPGCWRPVRLPDMRHPGLAARIRLHFSRPARIWFLSLGDRTLHLFLEARRKDLSYPQFSPDGKWLAYVSEESGSRQVEVVPIPLSGERYSISTRGGQEPPWNPNGRVLRTRQKNGPDSATAHSSNPPVSDTPHSRAHRSPACEGNLVPPDACGPDASTPRISTVRAYRWQIGRHCSTPEAAESTPHEKVKAQPWFGEDTTGERK